MSLYHSQAQNTFTVVLDPGHGGRDPGCVGKTAKEKNINLDVTLQLGKMIEQNHKNVKVIYTRKTDVFIPLDERANIANRNKADLFISIHVNSIKKGNAYGAETYTIGLASSSENLDVAMRENSVILMEDDYLHKYEGFNPNSSESYIIFELIQNKHMEQSIQLASEIQKSFAKINRHNRGVRQAGLLVLRKTSMPSVLIELGFISNREEELYMLSEKGKRAFAESIFKAFSNYKYDHDRKLGYIGNGTIEPASKPVEAIVYNNVGRIIDDEEYLVTRTAQSSPSSGNSNKTANSKSNIIYKIQILTSDKKLSEKDKKFKGYGEISFYEEKGIYKYTYGATSDYRKILDMYKKAVKDFKDAFIIEMKDGKRVYK